MTQSNSLLTDLLKKHARELPAGTPALPQAEVSRLMQALPGWETDGKQISKTFSFKNYYHTMAFVNAVAWIAHEQNHHPDLEVGYNKCVVRYSTHSVGGLSENDLICAAKVAELVG